MTLSTMVKKVTVKCNGDVVHELFKEKPHQISEMSSGCINSVDLIYGEWGAVGSVVVWKFIQDGKPKVSIDVVKAVDEEKKLVCYEAIGGDLIKDYKTLLFTIDIDMIGEEKVVTWTIHYEKANENVEDPNSLMDICVDMIEDIDNHHLAKSN